MTAARAPQTPTFAPQARSPQPDPVRVEMPIAAGVSTQATQSPALELQRALAERFSGRTGPASADLNRGQKAAAIIGLTGLSWAVLAAVAIAVHEVSGAL